MTEKQQILSKQGKFWLSGTNAETAAFGIISVMTDGSTRVSLGQNFNSLSAPHHRDHDIFFYKPHVVLGTLEDGRYVTLPEAYVNNSSLTAQGLLPDSFRSQSCIITRDFNLEENPLEKVTSIYYPLGPLLPWFRPALPKKEKNEEGNPILILPPQTKEIYQLQSGSITIENEILLHYDLKKREAPIKHSAYLTFTPKTAITTEDVVTITKSLEDFLMLFTNQTIALPWPTLRLSNSELEAEIYFTRMDMAPKEFSHHDCWLYYESVRSDFQRHLEQWFSLKEAFGPAFYLYAGNRRARSLYDEHRFMNCVTGLESFHYGTGRGISPTPALTQKVERILNALSPALKAKDRRWAENQSKQCLEPTLAERLRDLISLLPISIASEKLKPFSERCAKLRNDISHYGGPRSSNVDYKKFVLEIHIKARALEILYHALLLQQIGISPQLLRAALQESFVGGQIKYELKAAGLDITCAGASP